MTKKAKNIMIKTLPSLVCFNPSFNENDDPENREQFIKLCDSYVSFIDNMFRFSYIDKKDWHDMYDVIDFIRHSSFNCSYTRFLEGLQLGVYFGSDPTSEQILLYF